MTIIRERLSEVAGKFDHIDVALFTSFNFNADFFEQNVLPALFGVDESASRAVRAYEVNKALAKTDVGVFYDPSVAALHGKPCRYTHYPVFIPGALFHAKNIFLIGKSGGQRWIYVATLSANLSLSGWGRNREVIADTWIHCKNEQPWDAVSGYLAWLQKQFPSAGKAESPLANAIKLLSEGIYERRTLVDPEGGAWQDKKARRLYFSPLYDSFWQFIAPEVGVISRLAIAAPYWGTPSLCIEELAAQCELDDEIALSLVMAQLPPLMRTTGLGKPDADTLSQQWHNFQLRVWDNAAGCLHHLKAYRFETDSGVWSAVGSCNFSEPGLFWKRKSGNGKSGFVTGNVESMMLDFGSGPEWKSVPAKDDDFAAESLKDDAPEPWPFHVLVFYDWKTETFTWFVKGDIGKTSAVLTFSGHRVALADNTKEGSKKGKLTNGLYSVKLTDPDTGKVLEMTGCVIELNLQESTREYTVPLAAESILLSWIQGAANEPLPKGLDDDEPTAAGEGEQQGEAAGIVVEQEAPFFEFFDFYRAVRELGLRLQELEKDEDARADLLLYRADSVVSLASVILASAHDAVIKYLVLTECLSLISSQAFEAKRIQKNKQACAKRLFRECSQLREAVKQLIKREKHHLDEVGMDTLLAWYDKELRRS